MTSHQSIVRSQEVNTEPAATASRSRPKIRPTYAREPETIRQKQLAQAIFSLETEGSIKGFTLGSNSILPFISYLEGELQKRVVDYYQPILDYCCFSQMEDKAPAVVHLVKLVSSIMRKRTDREISIDDVIHDVGANNGVVLPDRGHPVNVKQGMFSLLGFVTMLLEIPKGFSQDKMFLAKPLNSTILYTRKPLDDTKLPLGVLIASFGVFIPRRRKQDPVSLDDWPPKQPESIDLSTSVLNAYAMTKVGKLKIEWSELFSSHLIFERNTRTVSVFRFPTFCALNCSRQGERTLFDYIMDIWDEPESTLADANRSMFREALLSYRLLFGQNFDSRSLFRSQEMKRASSNGYTDQLLVRLCGSSDEIGLLTDDDTFYEQPFYDSVIDFPHFGPRLEFLQKYISTRKSGNIKDLWQDRRDPERWVLIWVVLMLTIVTIVLSLVQIGLGACQVRLAQVQVELAKRALMEESCSIHGDEKIVCDLRS